jgi:methyltransferase
VLAFVIAQRLLELWIARRNARWMKEAGAIEVGRGHYPVLIGMHIAFMCSLIWEGYVRGSMLGLGSGWLVLLICFIVLQILRVWTLFSLGPYWNTRIFVLPGAKVIKNGPYHWVRHPNYMIVTLEIVVLSVLLQAYWTAVVFSVLNAYLLLCVRIPAEEKALRQETDFGREGGPDGA